ncbi:MAG: Sigma-70 region 2 [Chitinophagaceae bacterium]|nr:Sigma-70 region 2 [Chitinophagaceae bacterium]
MLDEKDIIKGCKKSESSSQQVLYNLYKQKMYGVCLRYISDKDEAKDVLQDGFVKVFQNFAQYKGDGSLEGWIRRVIVNTALTYLRKKKKIVFEPLTTDEQLSDSNSQEQSTALSEIDFTEEELLATINLLPDDFKIVFNLFCLENYSHKEISELIKINENTSRSRLNRARHLLQNYLLKMIAVREQQTGKSQNILL